MKSRFHAGICFILMAIGFAAPALATREPKPIQIDHRVRTVMYQPDQVYKYTGFYRFQTSIEFAPDEEIRTISMGDSTAWMLNPVGNRLFLKPVEQDATTNMMLITSKHVYLFELHARETEDINDKDLMFVMRFIYPDAMDARTVSQHLDSVPNPEESEDPSRYNYNYTISGSDTIAPIRIFDDGEFTFFQFQDKNAEVPAFFSVDEDGKESLINYRTRGDYIVVERVGKRFTLRHGNTVVCVFNEARLGGKRPPMS